MLGADDEVRVERPGRRLVRCLATQLLEEPGGQPQRRVRLDRLEPLAQPGERGQGGRRDRGDGACLLDGRRPQRAVHGAPRRDRGAQRIHRAGGRWQAPQDVEHLRGERGAGEVRIGLPVAGPEELRDLRVRAALDELADRIPAVLEAPGLAVDHRQRRLAGEHPLQAGREGARRGFHLRGRVYREP